MRTNGKSLPPCDGTGQKIAIVCSTFNKPIVQQLLDNTLEGLEQANVREIEVVWVPGAFEIPLLAKKMAASFDAVICLGCVIRGETAHFEHVATQTARGIMQVSLDMEVPIIFGVLTTENQEQAESRTNLGFEYAVSAIEMVKLMEKACV